MQARLSSNTSQNNQTNFNKLLASAMCLQGLKEKHFPHKLLVHSKEGWQDFVSGWDYSHVAECGGGEEMAWGERGPPLSRSCLESSVREETTCFVPSYVNVYPTSTPQMWRAGQMMSDMPAGWQASPQTNAHLHKRKELPCSKIELWVCAIRNRQCNFEAIVSLSAFFFITLQSVCWPMLLARFWQKGILDKNTKNFSILDLVSNICNVSLSGKIQILTYHWVKYFP